MRRRNTMQLSPRPVVRRKEIPPECIWSVSASSDYSWPSCWLAAPSNVIDRDETTEWSSRSPAWIRFDLGASAPCVSRIELLPSLTDEVGFADCRVSMGMTVTAMEVAMTMSGSCGHRKWIDCTLNQSRRARFVEIHIANAPKWAGWVRIRIWTEC